MDGRAAGLPRPVLMRVLTVESNRQRLDGGAMFGHCPRALWSRWCTPDEWGRIELATRGLLVIEDSGRVVLFEAGLGNPFPPPLRERYGVRPDYNALIASLAARGVRPEDVELVVLSHLHFDHAGGILREGREDGAPELAFPRARFLVSRAAWERARCPHPRDRASFLPELAAALEGSARLEIAESAAQAAALLGEPYRFAVSEGHTPGLLHVRVEAPRGPIWFLSDLVPGRPWLRLPITMGYDRCAERLVDEKAALLARIEAEEARVCFVHDPEVAVARVARDERGNGVPLLEAAAIDEG